MKNDWNPSTWVLILEYLSRAIQWIPTWQSFDDFQKSLLPCALDEGSLSIGSFLSEWVTNLWHLIPMRFLPQPLREDMAIWCPPDTSNEVKDPSAARPLCHGGSPLSEWVTNPQHLIPMRFLPQPLREDMTKCFPDTRVRGPSAARPSAMGVAPYQNGSLTHNI